MFQKPSPLINMEVGPVSHSQPPKPVMPVSVKKTAPVKTAKAAQAAVTNNKNVNFNKGGDEDEKKREKYLTAKYGAHQYCTVLYCTALYCTVLLSGMGRTRWHSSGSGSRWRCGYSTSCRSFTRQR